MKQIQKKNQISIVFSMGAFKIAGKHSWLFLTVMYNNNIRNYLL